MLFFSVCQGRTVFYHWASQRPPRRRSSASLLSIFSIVYLYINLHEGGIVQRREAVLIKEPFAKWRKMITSRAQGKFFIVLFQIFDKS